MHDEGPSPPAGGAGHGARHLDSWGEIAAFLHRSVSTVQRWERNEDLPVHRIAHSKQGSVYAKGDEIDAWYQARSARPAATADSASAARIKVAVLPFQNLSGSPDQDYLADGLTEELITQLARLRPDRLAVIARTSAMQYRESGKEVRAIGAELGVAYVLEGSVRRGGDRLRVSAKLVATSDGELLWADTYEHPLTDVIEIQTAISERVADSLSIHLLSDQHEAHVQARQTGPEALDEYLKGRYFWFMRTPDGYRQAFAHFQRSLEHDPAFAPAHAGLADAYAALGFWAQGVLAPKTAFPQAREAAERALALDPGFAEAYATLGFVQYEYEWDWTAADLSFRRATTLNPSYATGRQWYSLCLAVQGRYEEALAENARARSCDPLAQVVVDGSQGWIHYFARDYESAREHCERTLELNPGLPITRLMLASVYCFLGRMEDALREHDAFDRLHGAKPVGLALRACHHARAGERRRAEETVAALRQWAGPSAVFSWQFAMVHANLGNADEAFAALERAFAEREDALAYLKVEPHWDPLRPDPRFGEMLRRVGLG